MNDSKSSWRLQSHNLSLNTLAALRFHIAATIECLDQMRKMFKNKFSPRACNYSFFLKCQWTYVQSFCYTVTHMFWDKPFRVRFQEDKETFISTASRTYSEVDRARTENSSLDNKGLLRKNFLWSHAEVKILGPIPVLHNVFVPWCLIKQGVTLSKLRYLQFSQFHCASWYYHVFYLSNWIHN